jgi:hypothetical protein
MSTFTLSPDSRSGSESAGSIGFTLSRSSSAGTETVYVSTTQTEGYSNSSDYSSLLNQAFTFNSGELSKTVTINLTNDSVVEPNETFGLIVQAHSTDPITTYLDKSTFTIQNDDAAAPSTFTLSPGSSSASESAGSISFTLSRSSSAGTETVYVSTTQTEGYSNSGDYSSLLNQAFKFKSGEL